MPHKREQILDAIVAAVTGLVTTGTNVKRARVYSEKDTALPSISVYQGGDSPQDDSPFDRIDSHLTVITQYRVKTSSQQVDELLNQIDVEVTKALQADHTLGLAFVFDIEEGEADEPDLDNESSKPTASMRKSWTVKYQRSRTDPEA